VCTARQVVQHGGIFHLDAAVPFALHLPIQLLQT
jgi:hypothetical protein